MDRISEILKRGWCDAFKFFGGWQALIPLLVIPPVGFALHYRFGSPAEVQNELYIWIIYVLASAGLVFATILAWSVAAAPYRIERDAHAKTSQELIQYQSGSSAARERQAMRLATAETFEIWEVACLLAGEDFHCPVVSGLAFMEQEQLKRDFLSGKLILKNGEGINKRKRLADSMAQLQMFNEANRFTISDAEPILRKDLVKYLKGRDIKISGLG